jgi:hypothetical protein
MPEQLIVFTNHVVIGGSDDEGDDHFRFKIVDFGFEINSNAI